MKPPRERGSGKALAKGPAFGTVEWFLGYSQGGESTRRYYTQLLSKMQWMIDRPLAEATTRDLDGLKAKLRQMRSGLQHVRTLRGFYTRCANSSRSPEESFRFRQLAEAAQLKIARPRMDPHEILTPDDVNRLMAAALTLRDRALFGLLYETGCRISEALALDWSNVRVDPKTDDKPETYSVWFPKVKVQGEQHEGYIIDTAPAFKAWTDNHPTGEGPLFSTFKGERLTRGGAWKRLKDAAGRAQISKNVHPHSFRHARATHLLAAGWSEARVKKLLGWTPGSRMLDKYEHLSGNDVRRALHEAKGWTVPLEDSPVFAYHVDAVPLPPVKAVSGAALPRPGPRVPTDSRDQWDMEAVAALLEDPAVHEFLVRRLGELSRSGPAGGVAATVQPVPDP